MKNQKNTKVLFGLFLSIAVSSLFFTSCKKGDVGPAGATGAAGTNGTNGTNGANGANGTNGNTILSGEGAPDISLGDIGDFYLDTKVTALYGPKTSSGWGSPVSLVGAQGATGEPGTPGAPGDAGATALVDTFSVYSDDWMTGINAIVAGSNNNFTSYPTKYVKLQEPALTRDILDQGMIMISFTPAKDEYADQWLPIPYVVTGYDPYDTRVNYNWSYVSMEGYLMLEFYFTPLANVNYSIATATDNGRDPLAAFNVPDARYKVVMLPATVTRQIVSITKKQFTKTGKVLSNF